MSPGFDTKLGAAYYALAIEILAPRWTDDEARCYGMEMLKEISIMTTDRACISPIC